MRRKYLDESVWWEFLREFTCVFEFLQKWSNLWKGIQLFKWEIDTL